MSVRGEGLLVSEWRCFSDRIEINSELDVYIMASKVKVSMSRWLGSIYRMHLQMNTFRLAAARAQEQGVVEPAQPPGVGFEARLAAKVDL